MDGWKKPPICLKCGGTSWVEMPVISYFDPLYRVKIENVEVPKGIPKPLRCQHCGSVRTKVDPFEIWLRRVYIEKSGELTRNDVYSMRADMGLTQEDLAELLGIDVEIVEGWESGRFRLYPGESLVLNYWHQRSSKQAEAA
jgi:DNA-binding XRE family transcriptional regulator